MDNMVIEPIPPHVLLSFDIRPVLTNLDMYSIQVLADSRYREENNINPDYAMIVQSNTIVDQKIQALKAQVIDDFIITTINSFEHTWIQRDLKHITFKEMNIFDDQLKARSELYQCVRFQPEYAGMFAHYQRIGDTIFIAVPKY